ncbi:integrin alpha-IIb-like [Halichondria panicea]|uniref:integrin alpha-IIb-like n=1 Tax=Halichondria panicea TaxID=6063 RepID=UPI00312B2D3C
MSRLLCLFCFATVCVWEGIAQNQNNVDVREPVLRISPDRSGDQNTNDYFGWAAIFHATETANPTDTIDESLSKLRLIVGAPWGTFNGGLSLTDPFLPRQDRTGLVYSCPLTPGACEGVRGNTSSYIDNELLANNMGSVQLGTDVPPDEFCEGRLFDQAPNAEARASVNGIFNQYDDKEGQLLGSVLYSTGDIFVACAPRWKFGYFQSSAIFTRGVCYHGGRDLTGFTAISPCSGTVLNSGRNGAGTVHGSFCLGGTSIVVNDNQFVVSAPGHSANRGLLASVSTVGVTSTTSFTLGTPAGVNSVNVDLYQGFQVINAYILIQNVDGVPPPPNLVASVPRAGDDYNGQLIVYNTSTTLDNPIVTPATGSQLAEFFGYSLAAGDLNNDRYDEVLVGAPMYSMYTTNGAPSVERGRVYIVRNLQGTLSGDDLVVESPLSFVGGARARFGTSVAFLGDIDRDGYNDFAVGAPYYMNEGVSDTGAVFIYYGRANMTETATQKPFMIFASTLRSNVMVGAELLTFGWSLFSGVDVDNNGYNDLIVGAYESQAVFVLRSLPVADIFVTSVPGIEVDVDNQMNFELTITARFNGTGLDNMLSVNFEVREIIGDDGRRVFFDSQNNVATIGKGTFTFPAPDTDVSPTVTVYTDQDISDFSPYRFSISLVAIERTVNSPVSGNQAVTSLSPFPSLRHRGDTTAEVPVRNVCGNDTCTNDLMFSSPFPQPFLVVANMMGANDIVDVSIRNNDVAGIEPASGIQLVISDLPDFVNTVVGERNIICGLRVNNTVTCRYDIRRLNPGITEDARIVFRYNTDSLIGNEMPDMSNLLLVIPATNGVDNNLSNNGRTLTFQPTARANLAVTIEFSPAIGTYRAVAPSATELGNGVSNLGNEITLLVNVNNSGPSTIRNGILNLYLPSSDMAITGELTYLYPYLIRIPVNSQIVCSRDNLDTSGFVGTARKRRSTMTLTESRAARAAREVPAGGPEKVTRRKRQEVTFDLDCMANTDACTMFSCSITDLPVNSVSFTLHTRVDDRFFATLTGDGRRVYNLRAHATVSNNEDVSNGGFYTRDILSDNTAQTMVMLRPAPMMEDQGILIHVILWPVLGGLLILVVLIVVLYFCGFFRRKTKPEDGEIEGGDFEVEGTKGSYTPKQLEPAPEAKPVEEESKA